jgi:hypothetical protein
MEARSPFRPGWPRVRIASGGLGFPAPTPNPDRALIAPAQSTAVIDGVKLVAESPDGLRI